jgi:hypothetical protein
MTQEVRLFCTLRPKLDGVAKGVHRLGMSADEGAAEVNVVEVVDLGLEERDLTDVVRDRIEEGHRNIGSRVRSAAVRLMMLGI